MAASPAVLLVGLAATVAVVVGGLRLRALIRLHLLRHGKNIAGFFEGKRILLVVAHPDDECMFFAPLIEGLHRGRNEVTILCLSTGNYDGLGSVRRREFAASCRILGCTACIIDDARLQDGPRSAWDAGVVAQAICTFCATAAPFEAIATFDEGGISGHPNHVAVHHGVEALFSRAREGRRTAASVGANVTQSMRFLLNLQTVGFLQKHVLGLFSEVFCWLPRSNASRQSKGGGEEKACSASAPRPPQREERFALADGADLGSRLGHRAMMAHASQLAWFRHLYMATSLYIVYNRVSIRAL